MKRVAIIGAGLAGLTLAQSLKSISSVFVFEKSRGVGGRMATRYAPPYEFDHGTQYFTAKTLSFKRMVKNYRDAGIISDWPVTVASVGGAKQGLDEKFIAVPRMNQLCKSLSEGLDIQLSTQIGSLEKRDGLWALKSKDGQGLGEFDWVISTAPAPQAALLMPENFSGQRVLENVRMEACFTLMLGYEKDVDFPWAAVHIASSPVGWVAINSSKKGRESTKCSLLIQSTNKWAQMHLEDNQDDVRDALIDAAQRDLQIDLSGASHIAMHRWRYAFADRPADVDYLLDEENQLAASGDWCLGARVEAAFTSASMLSGALSEVFGAR